jgi:hypothetical protein
MTLLIKGIVEICNSDQSIQNGLHDIVDVALHGSDGKVIDGDRDCTIVKKSQLFGFPLSLACRLGNHRFPAAFDLVLPPRDTGTPSMKNSRGYSVSWSTIALFISAWRKCSAN